MTTRILKLINGDDVICELIESHGEKYKIKNALRIIEKYNQKQDTHNIFMIKWLPYTSETIIQIPINQIIALIMPTEDVECYYYQRTDEIFSVLENEMDITEEDVMLLNDFEDMISELPDDDDIIH